MKKAISALAALVLALLCALPCAAEILYDDPFDEINSDFWVVSGTHFEIDEGRLDGWDDAVIQQSKSDWNNPAPGAFIEYTAWVDVFIEPIASDGPYTAGIWYTNICSYMTGYMNEVERYKLHYNCEDSTVYLLLESERRIKNLGDETLGGDRVLGSLKLEDEPGENFEGEPVRLGMRVEKGKITAYANGKLVCEHSYSHIGQYYSAIVLCNYGCHADFDNLVVGDLEEDVAWRTLREGDLSGVRGDLTGDGRVNARDVCALMKLMVEGAVEPNDSTDYNGDGKVNCRDAIDIMLDMAKKKN